MRTHPDIIGDTGVRENHTKERKSEPQRYVKDVSEDMPNEDDCERCGRPLRHNRKNKGVCAACRAKGPDISVEEIYRRAAAIRAERVQGPSYSG